MTTFKRCCLMMCLVAVTVGCDRVTKHMAVENLAGQPARSFLGDTVRIAYAENTGAFLSLGADLPQVVRTVLFTGATGILLALLATVAWRSGWGRWRAVGLSLFIAGGLSNWIDRVIDGRVIDFLNVGIGNLRTGVFNVADMAIMAGMAVFLLSEGNVGRKQDSH